MFKNYYLGNYRNFSSDIGPGIHCIGIHGEDLVGVEVGTYKADSMMTILENCPNVKTIYGIDHYRPYFDIYENREITHFEVEMIKAESLLKQKYCVHSNKIIFLECTSDEAVKKFADESLDFIFIDADHHYEQVFNDLTLWYPKLKTGGLLIGHDYEMDSVNNAVNDFRKEHSIKNLMNAYLSSYIWKK